MEKNTQELYQFAQTRVNKLRQLGEEELANTLDMMLSDGATDQDNIVFITGITMQAIDNLKGSENNESGL